MIPRSLALPLALLVAVGAPGADVPSNPLEPPLPAAPADSRPPGLRLPAGVRPLRASVELTVLRDRDYLEGTQQLEVALDAPTSLLWLHGEGLTVSEVMPQAEVVVVRPGYLGLRFARPLPPGTARITLRWRAPISVRENEGAFRQQEEGEWYVLSHSEPLAARRIMPCFDEPSFKIPWRFSLRIPKSDEAYFNTASVAIEPDGELKRVRFAETRPLPSYLLAFAVGPFDHTDAGTTRAGTKISLLTTRGKGGWGRFVSASARPFLETLEDWFGIPYAYGKLDLVEVPAGWTAMENPGLVTMSRMVLLARPGQEPPGFSAMSAEYLGHELAHQWVGNLATMRWWDDLWLSEAFATWMSLEVMERQGMAAEAEASRADRRSRALAADELVSARRIRQPIGTDQDIHGAFDSITYSKGMSVIRMFERWLGPERFRRGARRFVREHTDGHTTTQDFLAAISTEAGRDVAPAFSSFLDQNGVPLVTMRFSCTGQGGRLNLAQRRYLPLGARQPPAGRPWQIPVCVRYGTGNFSNEACTLLIGTEGALELPACPEWLLPNAGAVGYYRLALDGDALDALIRNAVRLTVPERLLLHGDSWAAVRSGALEAGRALDISAAFASDPDRSVVELAAGAFRSLLDKNLISPSVRLAYARRIRELFGPRARALGFTPHAGEDIEAARLRPGLITLVAEAGQDQVLKAEAVGLAMRWLEDHTTLDPAMAKPALILAAATADRPLFERLVAAVRKEQDRSARGTILEALGSVRDPQLLEAALALTLSPDLDARQGLAVLWRTVGRPDGRDQGLAFLERHFHELKVRVSDGDLARLIGTLGLVCEGVSAAKLGAAFGPKVKSLPNGERLLEQALEEGRICATQRERELASVEAWFSGATK